MKTKITILSLVLVMAGCGSNKPLTQPPQEVEAQTIKAQAGVSTDGLRFSAVVMPDSQVPLAFRIPGYVISLKQVRGQDGRMRDIAEGDRVTRGAVLVRIRSSEYEDKVRQASSQAAAADAVASKAQLDFDRAKRLYASESITKPDFDSARAQYDASQEELKSARALTSEAQIALHDTSLVASFDGDIVKKSVELGAFVGPGSPAAFTIAKTDLVKIVVGVPDTVVRSVKVGQPIEVAIDAFPTHTFHARISRMSSAADTVTRNFDVEVAIPNRDHLLKVGMIGSLQLANGDARNRPSGVQVPLSAIVQAKDGTYGVFVVFNSSSGDVGRLRSVEIGAVNGTEIAVANGLATGDRIITNGANLLKDGQRVEVLQ
ncbi:MAG: efflux RND transporter periplasmic adaptor subunit [Acidobacteria bacterium]|nr:efflux RND transporter periplasmic adaptor subunit [Acidobacteriota bacterium]